MLDVDKQPEWEDVQTGVVSQTAELTNLKSTNPKEQKNETL